MIDKLTELFKKAGYEEWGKFRYKDSFTLAYKNEFEAYLCKFFDSEPKEEDIQELQDLIYSEIIMYSNDNVLKYSVFLLICYQYQKSNILNFENSKYTCRKIIINTSDDETFSRDIILLPFVDVERKQNSPIMSFSEILKKNIGIQQYDFVMNKSADEIYKEIGK